MTARQLPPLKDSVRYERVRIQGRLVTLSPLRIASGFEHQGDPDDDNDPTVPMLCRDAANAPYIPASTLRGLLRASLDASTSEHLRLFGSERLAADPERPRYQPEHGVAGRLRVYDARWSNDQADSDEQRQWRVSLDPITGTAANNLLFAEVTLPAGCSFDWELELDRVDDDDLRALILALRALEAGPGIGGGRARGQGQLQWLRADEHIEVIKRKRFHAWLRDPDLGKGPDHADYLETRSLDDAEPAARPDYSHIDDQGNLRLALQLYAQSPLLVSPERTSDEQAGEGANNVLRFPRKGQQTQIPASSLKGVLRAQARRILLTCLELDFPDANDTLRREVGDAMLGQLLGDTGCMSRLRLNPAEATFVDSDVHRQMMNAIDRFSGAVAERGKATGAGDARAPETAGSLFEIEAVRPAEPYTAELEIIAAAITTPWMRGLLLLLLRDGMEGDLRIGWGRARGFGAVRLGLELKEGVVKHWPEVMPALSRLGVGADEPAQWVDTFRDALSARMNQALEASA